MSKIIKITLYFLVLCLTNSSYAAVLKVDQKLTIENKNLKSSFSSISQLNAFVLDQNLDTKSKVSVTVRVAKPTTTANAVSIKKIWQKEKVTGKILEDNGCKKIKSNHFECSRSVLVNDQYQAQRLIWVAKQKMAFIMVNHSTDISKSKQVADGFSVIN